MNAKPLSRTWEWIGWLPLFLLTGLMAIPPGFIFGPYFSQTSGPLASVPSLTWYKTFLWTLDILTPLVTLALVRGFERVRGTLPRATKAYWLGMVAAAVIVGCIAACYFVWPRPAVPTLAEPDFALTCWLFCGTLKSGFAVIALISGLLTTMIAIALKRGLKPARWVMASLGLATLPIGLLLIVAQHKSESVG
ncbi:MAG: hypothetical protein HY260_19370 [Chloroflexi bacterium]|nr:hypothetical protein [Chloroflexota bacterium]